MTYRFKKGQPYRCPKCGEQTYILSLNKNGINVCGSCIEEENFNYGIFDYKEVLSEKNE